QDEGPELLVQRHPLQVVGLAALDVDETPEQHRLPGEQEDEEEGQPAADRALQVDLTDGGRGARPPRPPGGPGAAVPGEGQRAGAVGMAASWLWGGGAMPSSDVAMRSIRCGDLKAETVACRRAHSLSRPASSPCG